MKAVLFLATLGFLGQAVAQTSSPSTTPNQIKVEGSEAAKPKPKIFTASLLIDTSTTLAPGSAGSASPGEDYAQSGTYRLDLVTKLPWDLSLLMRASYSVEYSYVREDGRTGDFDDSRIDLSKKWGELAKDLGISTAVSVILPTSNDTRKTRLRSSVGLSAPLSYKWKKFDFGIAPKFTQNFHEVTVRDNGTLNTEYSIGSLNSVGYNFNDKLSASIIYAPSLGFTYQGTTRDRYSLIYEVGYSWTDHIATAVGLANINAAGLYRTGLDSNYTLYDATQTIGYFDLILTL